MSTQRDSLINDIFLQLMKVVPEDKYAETKNILVHNVYNYNINDKCYDLSVELENENKTAFELFCADKIIAGKSPKTISAYKTYLGLFFDRIEKSYKDVNINDIREFFLKYQYNGKRKLSNTYMNNIRGGLSSFFKWCHDEGLITNNPMARIQKFTLDTIKERAFTSEEVESLMYNATHIRDKAIMSFLFATACRIEETCLLDVDDIDIINKQVHIRQAKCHEARTIPIDDIGIFYLKEYLKWRNKAVTDPTNHALFVGTKGKHERFLPNGVRTRLNKIAKIAGVKHVHPHRYRVTKITILYRRGMSVVNIQKISGHRDPSMVEYYYREDTCMVETELRKLQ